MTYDLILGDYAYSSWSLRGWLLFEKFGLTRRLHLINFNQDVPSQLQDFAPAITVPTMRTPEGVIVSDSLAIAEELATRFPHANLWPTDPAARAVARAISAEMHSGFTALRSECPMNLRAAYRGVQPSQAVEQNLRRLEVIWEYARSISKPDGPWLCGAYSVADAFFAPVAARIAGYGLDVSKPAQAYVSAHLHDPSFRRWRAMGLVRGETLSRYAKDFGRRPWPGPAAMKAASIENVTPENASCPYSGDPSTHFLEMDGRVFGFCNAFCRDKTVADPQAWPAFMRLVDATP